MFVIKIRHTFEYFWFYIVIASIINVQESKVLVSEATFVGYYGKG